MIERLEQLTRDHAHVTGTSPQQQRIMFFDRSLYTPYVFTRANRSTQIYPELVAELKQTYRTKTVLCHTEFGVVKQRLDRRYQSGTEKEKEIRRNLGETNPDFILHTAARYSKLQAEGHFDLSFDTSHGTVEHLADQLVHLVDTHN